ncbi:hypothetical protein Hanom_Chr04g00351091 [Helianthus anomalus]
MMKTFSYGSDVDLLIVDDGGGCRSTSDTFLGLGCLLQLESAYVDR